MDTAAEEIAAVFARIQDGCARRDAAAVAALYAEDCVVETPIVGRQVGRSAVEHAYRFMFSAFPDLSLHTEEFLVFGNQAVWTVIATGSDLGEFMGWAPRGNRSVPKSCPYLRLETTVRLCTSARCLIRAAACSIWLTRD